MPGYMGYVALALLFVLPIAYLFWLKSRRNVGTGHNAKKGAGYPTFEGKDSGNYHDGGNDGGYGGGDNSPR